MTLEKIKALIAKQLSIPVEKVTNESRLVEDLGADSIDIVEMLIKLEDEFKVSIPDEDAVGLTTIIDIANYVDKKIKEEQ